MSFFNTMNIAASGLTAQRARMDIHAQNLANVDTTRSAEGGPYQRRVVIFEERGAQNRTFSDFIDAAMGRSLPQNQGVRVRSIFTDETPGPLVFDPGHPDAGPDGYLQRPNVNTVAEMVNMISASRSYEANITTINVTRAMMNRTLEISSR